ncbi:TrbI/VirB10 family protein [Terriglobus saanensis]|uniref:Conjugation TrbI family protein n=1 Tax=Terriglobus saanensis (strain ATCC BAA-1853 / DSM 23119 / SP1PR4) TaxID=401053 RepID=E8V1A6_TERSS|nr:TrbI/VirB10 family protein [Terriglobus saanensis]ADV84521.1 conjugation TrbI family protein [Terriglobus saanensis SP1PR4]
MTAPNQNPPATVPEQPEAKSPLKKGMPMVIVLVVIIALIGIANVSSLLSGSKKAAPTSAMAMRPASPNAQQVNSFSTQQQVQAQRDAEERQHQQELAAALQQLQVEQSVPGPEAAGTQPMTAAQRDAIYGNSPNAPQRTSNVSQAQAEAKQKALAKEKQAQDAINSDTVAIDFAHTGAAPGAAVAPQAATAVLGEHEEARPQIATEMIAGTSPSGASDRPGIVQSASGQPSKANSKTDAIAGYDFDNYQGHLYRVFEGTVFEGVVTNHIDGGLSGPILVMLTTDYYSHDHQQLLMPQGTRLIGTVQSVGNAQQRKMFVTFHRAVCPDGFSLDFDKYIGLDPLGTTGLATKVDHGYLMAFGAAAAVGGLGGLAQIGNNGSVLTASSQIRSGISEQSATEGEQVLNHFLNRLPIITLKEGSRARVYVGRDILIPSYAEHRVDPTM